MIEANHSYKDPRLFQAMTEHPFPCLFAAISGAHLYGFPSGNSDWDIRGAHLLPLEQVVGLRAGSETVTTMEEKESFELDFVTHDAAKYFRLLLSPVGSVLEQLMSPLVLATGTIHEELRGLLPKIVTVQHARHYNGFAKSQRRTFLSEDPPRIKPLLYTYRVLLTGIHLMKTGQIEANLVHLNEEAQLSRVTDLVQQKLEGGEKEKFVGEKEDYLAELDSLHVQLEEAAQRSSLPVKPTAEGALHDLLVRLRMQSAPQGGWATFVA